MKIRILHRYTAAVLFEHDAEENSMSLTVRLALRNKVSLRGADLRGADLRGVDLRGVDLRGAYLSGANLRGADLSDAYVSDAYLSGVDLRGADLRGADLRGVDLRGAYLSGANLLPIKADFIEVISRAPREVPALIAALKEGRVDGSTYEGSCACLVGTIANIRGADYRQISPDSSRPAERFFLSIKRGDTPETNEASRIALEWAQEFDATMRAAYGVKS